MRMFDFFSFLLEIGYLWNIAMSGINNKTAEEGRALK